MELNTVLNFLEKLKINNNRDWFNEHKSEYLKAKQVFENFVEQISLELSGLDDSIEVLPVSKYIFRIYRDARFCKNKPPYKNNFGAAIAKGGRKSPFAGYYMHIEPGQSFLGGGIYRPDAKVLKAIRYEIFENTEEFKSIISDVNFVEHFGEIRGEKLKTAPKGFPKDFADIDLLRYKDYTAMYKVDDNFWLKDNLVDEIIAVFKCLYPLNQFLNRAVGKIAERE